MEERYQKSFKKAGTSLPKLGMLYVASAIEEAGYDVRILDAQLERYNIAETTKAALEFSPDIIGITTETANMNRSRLLAEDIKKKKFLLFSEVLIQRYYLMKYFPLMQLILLLLVKERLQLLNCLMY